MTDLDHLRQQLADHRAAFVPFHASPAAQGCGRPPLIGPWTAAQLLYQQELDTWTEQHYKPWQRRHKALCRAVDAAVADASARLLATEALVDVIAEAEGCDAVMELSSVPGGAS